MTARDRGDDAHLDSTFGIPACAFYSARNRLELVKDFYNRCGKSPNESAFSLSPMNHNERVMKEPRKPNLGKVWRSGPIRIMGTIARFARLKPKDFEFSRISWGGWDHGGVGSVLSGEWKVSISTDHGKWHARPARGTIKRNLESLTFRHRNLLICVLRQEQLAPLGPSNLKFR